VWDLPVPGRDEVHVTIAKAFAAYGVNKSLRVHGGLMGVYVVTGSASGMGRAVAERLRAAGHTGIGVDTSRP